MSQDKKLTAKGSARMSTRLKVGDMVLVLAGGNSLKDKELKGKTGKILRFLPKTNRVVVEGLNMVTRHKRATSATSTGGKVVKEAPIHISNVMFYSKELSKGFRLRVKTLENGRKVRGFIHPENKTFEQIDV